MPPPSWANRATKLAPKPKPTMRNGASWVAWPPARPPYAAKMPHTPRSDKATTRKPETAPPRIATCTASTRLRRAAAAVRTFERTLMYMPMMPDAIEQAAPTRKATPVRIPRSMPKVDVSATSRVSNTVMTAPMMTAPTTASSAIVWYCRRMKASAPSRIVSATSCMACGPLSRDKGPQAMQDVADTIREGADAFIRRQYQTIALLAVVGAVIIGAVITVFETRDVADTSTFGIDLGIRTGIAFLVGAACSMASGIIGMYISVRPKLRTAGAAPRGLGEAGGGRRAR